MSVILKSSLFVVAMTVATANANAWYCTAESKTGAKGTGFNFFQLEAEKTALNECRANAKGKRCVITSCW